MSLQREKLLREYADTGDIVEIERLLEEEVGADAADSLGFTALEYAMNST